MATARENRCGPMLVGERLAGYEAARELGAGPLALEQKLFHAGVALDLVAAQERCVVSRPEPDAVIGRCGALSYGFEIGASAERQENGREAAPDESNRFRAAAPP